MKISAPSGVEVSVSVATAGNTAEPVPEPVAGVVALPVFVVALPVAIAALPVFVVALPVGLPVFVVALPVVTALPALPCSTVITVALPLDPTCCATSLPLPAPSVFLPPFDSTTATPAIAAPTTSTPAITNPVLPRGAETWPVAADSVVGAGVTTPLFVIEPGGGVYIPGI